MKHRVSWGGILLLVGIFAAAAVIIYTQSYKSSQDPDELWPEQGDVIATIDGKEYRYDQVYLFRLTGYWFPEDYRESTLDPEYPIEALGGILPRQQHSPYYQDDASYGIFWGDTWAENAICLELLYREAKEQYFHNATHFLSKKDTIEELTHDLRTNLKFYLEDYETLPGSIDLIPYGYEDPYGNGLIPFDRVAFEPGQSFDDYYRDDAPYIEKLYYLNECANSFLEKTNYFQIRNLLSKEEREEANQELFLEYFGLRDNFLVPRLRDALMEKYNVQMMTE